EELALCGNLPISVGHELVFRVRASNAKSRESLRLKGFGWIDGLWRGNNVRAVWQLHLEQLQRHRVNIGTVCGDSGANRNRWVAGFSQDAANLCLGHAALASEEGTKSFRRPIIGDWRKIDLATTAAIDTIALPRALVGREKKQFVFPNGPAQVKPK